MINWRKLNSDVDAYKFKYRNALPFPHLIIDGVCNEKLLKQATSEIPDPLESKANTSNDFIFAKISLKHHILIQYPYYSQHCMKNF